MSRQQNTGHGNKSAQAPGYLLPCPFCGGTDVGVWREDNFSYWASGCNVCDIPGPEAETKEDARKAWNTRSYLNALAVFEVLRHYKKETMSYPGNDYWNIRFSAAMENGCPCKVDPDGILTRDNRFDWCPIHGENSR